VEDDRSHDLGVQAAQGREIHRRLGGHRRRTSVFTLDRVPKVPNSPGPFTAYTR
jgi:hypothetical protein